MRGDRQSSDRASKTRAAAGAPLLSYAGNKLLTWSANVLFLTRLTDILTCYKVLRADVASALNLRCDGFDFDAEVPCRLLRQGYQIVEIPVTYNPRSIDEGKKLTPRVGWSVLRAILQVRFSRSFPGDTMRRHGRTSQQKGRERLDHQR